jgi:hypothetical protein
MRAARQLHWITSPPTVFIAGLRHLDRARGTGWLDCPNCHEHAAQDVIDDMTFVQALFYRFAPVGRKRVLVCRRCGYRRPATAEEMAKLETAGTPVHRAVMAPVGVGGIALVAALVGLVLYVSNSSANALANEKITLKQQSGVAIPVTFLGPTAWNYDPSTDEPAHMKVSDSGSRMYFVIKRATDGASLEEVLKLHYADEVGITTTGFPETMPAPDHVQVGGQRALHVLVDYTQGAEKDEQNIYVVSHNGVAYVIHYVALGDAAIKTMRSMAAEVNPSLKFTDAKETPAATPSTSAGASPSPSAGGRGTASPSPTH